MPPKLKKRSEYLCTQLIESHNEIDTSDAAVEAELKRISSIVARRMRASTQHNISSGGSNHALAFQRRPSRFLLNNASDKMLCENRRNSLPSLSSGTDDGIAAERNRRISLSMTGGMQGPHHPMFAQPFHSNSSSNLLNDTIELQSYQNRTNSFPGIGIPKIARPVPGVNVPSTHHQGQTVAGTHPSGNITDAELRQNSLSSNESTKATLPISTVSNVEAQLNGSSLDISQVIANTDSVSNESSDKHAYPNSFYHPTQKQQMWSNDNKADSFDTSHANTTQFANGITDNRISNEHWMNFLSNMPNFNQPVPGVNVPTPRYLGLTNFEGSRPSSTDAQLTRNPLPNHASANVVSCMASNQHMNMHHTFDGTSFNAPQVDNLVSNNEYLHLSNTEPYSLSNSLMEGGSLNEQSTQIESNFNDSLLPSNNDVNENHSATRKRSIECAIGYADVDDEEIIAAYTASCKDE